MNSEEDKPKNNNLLVLGIGVLGIAVVFSFISLFLYHKSGDIYLDRSRPGFLPEKSTTSETVKSYHFPSEGKFTKTDLEEYLRELNKVINELDNLERPFSPDSLSDQSLNIAD